MTVRSLWVATAAAILVATPAIALTLTNNGSKDHTVGIDRGAEEEVLKISDGKSVTVKGCDAGCGVTGPWDYSKFAKTGDEIVFDDKSTTYK